MNAIPAPRSPLPASGRSFWGPNQSASAQLAKVKDMTQGECARALREPDTQPATKGALLRRLRAFNAQRLNPPSPPRSGRGNEGEVSAPPTTDH